MSAPGLVLSGFGWLLFALAGCGVAYTGLSAVLIRRFFRALPESPPSSGAPLEGVTILKPLHGAEPGLARNLRSFLDQGIEGEAAAPVQTVFGIQRADDPARAVAEAQIARCGADAVVRLDPRPHGQNAKIANLINMLADARHPALILADSDIGAPPGYVSKLAVALAAPGAGVVTCPYYGRGEAGFWSTLAAMGLSYQFLPNVITGVSLGMASPCMGSTIALRRETLDRIGGFEAFADVLADDYAIGAAVRGLGLKSLVAPILVSHSCTETSLTALVAHEVRWARTVRGIDPAGHGGSLVTHPLALALLCALFLGLSTPALALLAAAFGARVWLMGATDRVIGRKFGPWWLIPARDMLSFFVFSASFFVRSVEWRGRKFQVSADGDLKPV